MPLCVPEVRGREWQYVKECLDTGWVSSVGAFVDRFEREFTTYLGGGGAVATVNGTSALHVALLVAGVKPEEEVLVSALTFVAPVNAIRYAGAWPVFVDAEPMYLQMDPKRVAAFLAEECEECEGGVRNRRTGRRVRAIMPVHILGHPVDMAPICEVARRYGLALIEDATESLGARYRGEPVGRLGDVACFSFNGNKLMTTGNGGMLVTAHSEWRARAKYLTTQAKDDPVEYVHHEVGYNYRLTNVQAAMGCAQLEQIDEFLAAKRRIAERYAEGLAGLPGISPMREAPWAMSAWWLYTIGVDAGRARVDSRQLMRELRARGIQTRPLWQPAHLNRPYRSVAPGPLPVAEALYRDSLSLPSSVGLAPAQQDHVIDAVRKVVAVHA